jgi:hypothetical protein
MSTYEQMVNCFVTGVLATNEEMVAHMRIAGWTAPIYNISGLAFGKEEVLERIGGAVNIKPFDQRTQRVGFAARFDQEKQPGFFMNLAEEYQHSYPDVKFAVFSGGPLRSNNQDFITELLIKLSRFSISKYAENNFQYDRRGKQNVTILIDKLISYQNDQLKSPLHSLSFSNTTELLLECNKYIYHFIHNNPLDNKSSIDLILSLLSKVLSINNNHNSNNNNSNDFNDEIFCQICKYLTRNPSNEYIEFAWQLLIICFACVSPSLKLLPSIKSENGILVEISTIGILAGTTCTGDVTGILADTDDVTGILAGTCPIEDKFIFIYFFL